MTTLVNTDLREQILAHADSAGLPGSSHHKISSFRAEALEKFAAKGFPGRKDEEYKYANIRPLLKGEFDFSTGAASLTEADINALLPSLEDAIRIVLVNGMFNKELSKLQSVNGLSIESLASYAEAGKLPGSIGTYADAEDPFVALNNALWTDGVVLSLARNCIVEKPVYCIHIATSDAARMNQQRFIINMEDGASATIIEHYETVRLSATSFTNNVTEIVMKSEAILHHYILQNECENGVIVTSTNTCLDGKATYHINTVTVNGSFVRNNLNIVLNHPFAEAHLYGLYAANGNSLVDNHTLVDHRVRDCQSNELYKGVIDDQATGVFNGKIFVRQDAQKTNAFQSNKNILLSDDASMNTKPQLEIYADDVKCSHGSSTGQIDQEALFYLRSRGIGPDSAKRLMIQAFADDVINNIKQEDFRKFVSSLVTKKLG